MAESKDNIIHIGRVCSLSVRIFYCQNSTWQGEVHWVEGEKSIRFRSLLELINLIQEAVEKSQKEPDIRNWPEWMKTESRE